MTPKNNQTEDIQQEVTKHGDIDEPWMKEFKELVNKKFKHGTWLDEALGTIVAFISKVREEAKKEEREGIANEIIKNAKTLVNGNSWKGRYEN